MGGEARAPFSTFDDGEEEFGTYLVELEKPSDWPTEPLRLRSEFFILFVAGDFDTFPPDEWQHLVRQSIDAGCAYVCTWGQGCETLHDSFDAERFVRDPEATSDRFFTTTWHDEPLDDALWFALFTARPSEDERFFGRTLSVVACSVGSPDYARDLAARLKDPQEFSKRVLAEDD